MWSKSHAKNICIELLEGDLVASCKGILLCIGWQDKKHVIVLTTEGSSNMITYNNKHNHEHAVPVVFHDHNLHAGGVDHSDMRTYMFLDERRTMRWNKMVFFTLLGKPLLNSYQQKTEVSEKLERRSFIGKVVEGLISDFRAK